MNTSKTTSRRGRPSTATTPSSSSTPSTPNLSKRRKLTAPVSVYHGSSGTLHTFGQNEMGQLGIVIEVGAPQRKFPAKVTDLDGVKISQAAAGALHNVVLTAKGEVYTFGCNDDGALGRVTDGEEQETRPGRVTFDTSEKIIQVTAGDSHSAALTESGSVFAWGSFRNQNGDIGLLPGAGKKNKPTLISFAPKSEPHIIKIASGSHHLVSLVDNGSVFTFGDGDLGQLGRYVSNRHLRSATAVGRIDSFLAPKQVSDVHMKYVCDIWAGASCTFCRTDKDHIWVFGLNSTSQLGYPSKTFAEGEMVDPSVNCCYIPKKPTYLNNGKDRWRQIAVGDDHTIALNSDGQVFAIGRGNYGRLGLGVDEREVSSPTQVLGALENEKCVFVECGGSTSYAITSSGKLFAWGFGENFQLGNGDDDDCNVPTLCKGARSQDGISGKVIHVAAGSQHVAIVTVLPEVSNSNKG